MTYLNAPRIALALLLPLFLMLLPTTAVGQYYRWVDENGVTQFSDSPPGPDGKPLGVPRANSVLPMSRNNANLRRKLPEPEPRYRSRNNDDEEQREEERLAGNEKALKARCERYVSRIEWINNRLRSGNYSVSYGNTLRSERKELSSKRAWECLFGN